MGHDRSEEENVAIIETSNESQMDDFRLESDESSDPITIRDAQGVDDAKPSKPALPNAEKARPKS